MTGNAAAQRSSKPAEPSTQWQAAANLRFDTAGNWNKRDVKKHSTYLVQKPTYAHAHTIGAPGIHDEDDHANHKGDDTLNKGRIQRNGIKYDENHNYSLIKPAA